MGILLQNEEDPRKFFSFGTWETLQNIKDWRAKPKFLEFIGRARELCEEMQSQTMRVVGYSNSQDVSACNSTHTNDWYGIYQCDNTSVEGYNQEQQQVKTQPGARTCSQ